MEETSRLAATFPGLQALGVTAFRDESWCKNVVYSRGAFSDTSSPTTCNLFEAVRVSEFDDQARTDFDRIAAAFRAQGFWPYYVNVEYDDGEVSSAVIELGCQGCESGSYLYDASGSWGADVEYLSEQVTSTWRWVSE